VLRLEIKNLWFPSGVDKRRFLGPINSQRRLAVRIHRRASSKISPAGFQLAGIDLKDTRSNK
jgi:hypothetical protein